MCVGIHKSIQLPLSSVRITFRVNHPEMRARCRCDLNKRSIDLWTTEEEGTLALDQDCSEVGTIWTRQLSQAQIHVYFG